MPLHRHHRRPLMPLVALWAALLLGTQTVIISHLHLDLSPDTACTSCPAAKAQVAASDPAGADDAVLLPSVPHKVPPARLLATTELAPFLARAPPGA